MAFDSSNEAPLAKAEVQKSASGGFGTQVIKQLGNIGWLDEVYRGAINSLSGWGMNPHGEGAAAPATPAAGKAKVLAKASAEQSGDQGNLAPALEAAAAGESVADQARKMSGPVTMTAADALSIAGQMDPEPGAAERAAVQQANAGDGGFQSPFVSVALSGIRNNQQQAEDISTAITGDATPHGYAAYGSNGKSYGDETGGDGIVSPGDKSPAGYPGADYVDAGSDVAAVTQYAAAAELGITLTPNANGNGSTVAIDWAALKQMEVSADLGPLGGKIAYDNPAAVADNGYQAVLAEIAQRQGGDPTNKEQFISLTGHSGGGQSSFYTALKLASEGYTNLSLVGVDMAMTPHQRQVLEALGVQVTNITSNNKDENGQASTSEIGDVIRTGMGGGQNFYDINVERQRDANPLERHDIANDPNVATTVRFAQYLDSIGKHGQYMDERLYNQFLADTNGKGDDAAGGQADANLIQKITDQRALPGPEANSADPAQASSVLEKGIKWLGGDRIESLIKGAGTMVTNGADALGDTAGSWLGGMFSGVGGFVGGLANQGLDFLGSGVNAIGGLLGAGLDGAGDLAQGLLGGAGDVVNFLGSAANSGLDFLGNGVSSIGNTVNNGLDRAGDSAKSWLGGIPLIGGFLGDVANGGLDLLGSGVGAVSNLVGGGLDVAGDVAQSTGGFFSGAMNLLGGAANTGLDLLGSGVSAVGGLLGNGLDKAGDAAQSGIGGAMDSVGGWAGGLLNGGIDWVGRGVGGLINNVGDWAGDKVTGLVHLLQGVGIDTSLIDGFGNYGSTNPSQARGWERLLSDPNDPSIQKINVPGPSAQNARATTGGPSVTDSIVMGQLLQNANAQSALSAYAE